MGEVTVRAMESEFGCRAQDMIAAIGPSIGRCCYEVSEDVAQAFEALFPKEKCDRILTAKGGGKYMLDLWEANYLILTAAGILPENVIVTDLCTRCHSDLLWSHRATGGQRGGMCGFLQLLEEGAPL